MVENMKFYVVGISSRYLGGPSPRVYGDALVYAPDKYTALSLVRPTVWVPNPGGIYLLGTETQKDMHDYMDPEDINLVKEKAREEG